MKQDVQIHVKLDTYVKLSELRARLRKRCFDEVIKELIKVFEASVASATSASSVANPSYRLGDRSEGGGIVVEVSDGERFPANGT